ncbi:hypothetical protein C8R45DRAFT_983731 [Mycena sanguinolenta]|nr:hypothetical protein C8R45DRAFT_983731 [Mycena sanguinolenta]
MYGQRSPFPQSTFDPPPLRRRVAHANPLPNKSRTRAGPVPRSSIDSSVVVSRRSPLRDIPTEIGLEIIELALLSTSPSALALVSKKFNALVCKIIYRTVALDGLSRIAQFHQTVSLKSPEFLGTHVLALAVTSKTVYNTTARNQLEDIVAACTGLRTLAIPRPGILASSKTFRTRPIELIIQKFDAVTPFEWDPPFAKDMVDSPAPYISQNLSRLRLCEPGEVFHSPLASLEFFGPLPRLTHLALARHVNPDRTYNDGVFVNEIRTILETRPRLEMLVVSLFPVRWPHPLRIANNLCGHGCICKALIRLADADKRLVILAAGWDAIVEKFPPGDYFSSLTSPPHANHGDTGLGNMTFWENWRLSDKRVVSFATCWEPEVLQDAPRWTYPTVREELFGGHNFWENWATLPESSN